MARVTVTGGAGFEAQMDAHLDRLAIAGLSACGQAAHAEIIERLSNDLDERGFRGRVDTGTLGQAIAPRPPEREGATLWRQETVVEGGEAQQYAHVVESGRAPGKPISWEGRLKILKWVQRKLSVRIKETLPGARIALVRDDDGALIRDEEGGFVRRRGVSGVRKGAYQRAIEQVAFLVIRAIRNRGIPGLHPFENTRKHFATGGYLQEVFARGAADASR